jgi:hypothetical protein
VETYPNTYANYEQSIYGKPRTKVTRAGNAFPARPAQQQYAAPARQPVPQLRQGAVSQKPVQAKPKPMPKARALALVNTLKKSLVVASLAAFVSFGGLAAFHQVGTTSSGAASTSSTSTSSSQNSGKNILKQTGGNNIGTSTSSQGTSSSSSSSSGTSSSSSSAVSGSSVS